jgi:peroxiredoxin
MIRSVFALAVALAVSQQAPDFNLRDQNGKTINLAAARGHKVVLVFYRGYW